MKQSGWLKRVFMVGSLIWLLSAQFFAAGVYAGESSDSNNSNNNNNGSAGQSLYDALSRIYGNTGNRDSSSGSGSSGSNSNQNQVPVQDQIMQGLESEVKGPQISDGSLSETFHENYRVYEERLNDDVSIFTNVANGSVVNYPVVMEFPTVVGARMKRNGREVSLRSKEAVSEAGSYVVTFYVLAEDQDDVPFSAQNVIRAKFRFRIQYEAGVAGYEATGENPGPAGLLSDAVPTIPGVPEDALVPSVSENDLYFEEEENPWDIETADEYEPEEEPEDEAQPAVSGLTDAAAAFLAANGMNGAYDPASGYYLNTLLTGDHFYTNVPNGMLTNEPVVVQAAENLEYTVYKNGEVLADFEAGQYIRDPGSYKVLVKGTDPSFATAYSDDLPEFSFRIITDPVSDLGVLNAPENMTFRSVRYEGGDISSRAIIRPDMVRLIEDGTYEITMESPYGSDELVLSLDTLQPLFDVSVVPNLATVRYRTSDVAYCILYKNGELMSNTGIITEITEAGEYSLTAYDRAGNRSSASFRVSYRINAGAVVAILIVIALIAGAVVYLVRIKQKVSIR